MTVNIMDSGIPIERWRRSSLDLLAVLSCHTDSVILTQRGPPSRDVPPILFYKNQNGQLKNEIEKIKAQCFLA